MRMRESGTHGLRMRACALPVYVPVPEPVHANEEWNVRLCLLHVTRSVCASICKCVRTSLLYVVRDMSVCTGMCLRICNRIRIGIRTRICICTRLGVFICMCACAC